MTYILVDSSNLFHRARHVVRGSDIETKIGMAMHIIFSSISKCWRDFDGAHVVFCADARSWRRDFYAPYKAQRREARDQLDEETQIENVEFFTAFDALQMFLHEKTNVTVLQEHGCEADDFIARWVQNHPNDQHVIVSSDSDFYQLISDNVSQYNGITNQHITLNGIYDDRGRPVTDKKTGEIKTIGDPGWLLFEKCIRGDTSDNIFSAYPGARKKGSKNKVGMLEAFEDRHKKGFNWNNFLLQKWTDHEGVEHRVLDDYHRNQTLIDLTAQPDEIKAILDRAIIDAAHSEPKSQIGIHFMKFCGKYNLFRVGEQAESHVRYLESGYT